MRRAIAILALGVLLPGAGIAATLEGTWRLVEQRHAPGASNKAALDAPLRLRFVVEGGRLVGRVAAKRPSGGEMSWPAAPPGYAASGLEILFLRFSPASDRVQAEYRVASAAGGEEALVIREEYRLADGGGFLEGTVTVSVESGEKPGGSYILHRRFVRER
jgi:hypothetical protein